MRAATLLTLALTLTALTALADESVFESGFITAPGSGAKSASDQIDLLVLSQLHELKIEHAQKCSDSVFLRRVFLTTIGTLPTEKEARAFLASSNPKKRQAAVEMLLNRPEYVEYWAMKWGDVFRVKAEFPIKLWPNAVQAYHRWILASLKSNKPYDQFVRELLTGNGSNFREGEVNFYRAMQDRSPRGIAATVALTFMGERADKWPEKKLDAMAGFFAHTAFKPTAEWKEEIVFFDPTADEEELAKGAIFPDGTAATVDPFQQDPRQLFAAWLIRPENPYFARNITNRVWSWVMGRGIVHEVDDHRLDNPPSNPQLLEFLQREFVANEYDMKHLFRVILNSKAFQMSCIPEQDTPEAAANFAHYPLRRIEAEVLIDALNQITGTTEEYSSPIPEPFTFVPDNVRGIALGDGSITSSFLELFGRPPRDTGLDSERSVNNTPQQRLHLLNSSHVHKKIKTCSLVAEAGELPEQEMAEKIYLTVFSRLPSKTEMTTLQEYAESNGTRGKSLAADLVWALFNQPEFYFNH